MKLDFEGEIFDKLKQAVSRTQIPARLIGGCVRDKLLGRASKDLDIVVLGSGIEFARVFCEILGHDTKVTYFKNFGTAQVKYLDFEIEFVGARKESYQRESRNPVVEDGTLEDDQNRRDFTINAMSVSLNPEDFLELYDPFNGLEDLKNKIIRTPLNPETTFSDDPLRMLRAIRFAAQLNFTIGPDTLKGIIQCKERIEIISQERITEELNKMILSPIPSVAFIYLFDTGLLKLIFPEMVALHGVEIINGKGHKDNFYHTLQVLDNISEASDNLWLRWAAILHDIAKPLTKKFEPDGWTFHGHEDKGARMVKKIFKRLRLPLNEKMRYVEKLVFLHLRPIALSKEIVTDSAVRRLMVEAEENIDDLLILCKSDITSKNERKVVKYLQNLELVKEKIANVKEKDRLRNWQPPVTGNDIINTFVIDKPQLIGEIKSELRELILSGKVPDEYQPAFETMLELGKQRGLKLKNEKTNAKFPS